MFVIEDWYGNRKFLDKTFAAFNDAHDFLCQQFDDEESLQEFYIIQVPKED